MKFIGRKGGHQRLQYHRLGCLPQGPPGPAQPRRPKVLPSQPLSYSELPAECRRSGHSFSRRCPSGKAAFLRRKPESIPWAQTPRGGAAASHRYPQPLGGQQPGLVHLPSRQPTSPVPPRVWQTRVCLALAPRITISCQRAGVGQPAAFGRKLWSGDRQEWQRAPGGPLPGQAPTGLRPFPRGHLSAAMSLTLSVTR